MNNTLRYTAGGVAGFLLALGGVGIGFEKGLLFPDAKPQVQTRIVEKTVVKKVPVTVERKVYVTRDVTKPKLYRVNVLDDAGKVTETYDGITTFQFRIIGATLTDKAGKTFDVDGNITVEPVR